MECYIFGMSKFDEYVENHKKGVMSDTERRVHEHGVLIAKVVAGSQSFGLDGPESDVDIHGVYIAGPMEWLRHDFSDQIADEQNNEVYWEITKFLRELNSANPQALEMLYAPDKCILEGKWFFKWLLERYNFLTKRCDKSFCEYARGQVNRATGLNKKVFKPKPEGTPKVLDYCYVFDMESGHAVPVKEWLVKYHSNDDYGPDQKWYSLAAIDHLDMGYALYGQPMDKRHSFSGEPEHEWRWAYGIVRDEDESMDIQLNSIPKGQPVLGMMFFNRNAFSKECKERAQYRDWVKKRNPERYNQTIQHGQGYDAKNMMHCVRLLQTAYGIAKDHTVPVYRGDTNLSNEIVMEANKHPYPNDREFLLGIKRGEWTFDEIIHYIDELGKVVSEEFAKSNLPENSYSPAEMDELAQKHTMETLEWFGLDYFKVKK